MVPRPDPLDAAGDMLPAEIFPEAFKRGFGESLRRYGSLLEYLEAGFVNGFTYSAPVPSVRRGMRLAIPEGGVGGARAHSLRDPAAARDKPDCVRAQALARRPAALGP